MVNGLTLTLHQGIYIVADKVYSNRHLIVTEMVDLRKDNTRCNAFSAHQFAVRVKSWEWTTSLDVISICFERLKAGETLSMYPVLLGSTPHGGITQNLFVWPALPTLHAASSADIGYMSVLDAAGVSELHYDRHVFALTIPRKAKSLSAKVAASYNKVVAAKHQPDFDVEMGSSSSSDLSEAESDDQDAAAAFEESLGDLAEDAERRAQSDGSASSNATGVDVNSTYSLSGQEVYASISGDFNDLENEAALDKTVLQANENSVHLAEQKQLESAVKSSRLDLTARSVAEAILELEAQGIHQTEATVEVALNSEAVMGNTSYEEVSLFGHLLAMKHETA